MKRALLFALALAACSPPAPPKPTEGAAQKAIMDKATTAYANCIAEGAKVIPVTGEAAGTLGNRVTLACKDLRKTLMADVIAFHQIGHPKYSIDQSKAVAEASVATIEDELRQQAVVTIVQRQMAESSAAEPKKAP
jgi:putative hemolysin